MTRSNRHWVVLLTLRRLVFSSTTFRIHLSMAATNLSTIPTPSSLPPLSCRAGRYTPTLLFYPHTRTSLTLTAIPFSSQTSTIYKFKTQRLRSLITASAVKTLSEIDPFPVSLEYDDKAANLPSESGVYAVYDKNDELQFIGITRNIAASISIHRKSLPDLCYSVKIGVVEPQKEALTQAWKSWMEESIKINGKIPPGNESGNITWVRPRPKAKPDIRLTPGRHMQLTVPLEELIDKLVKENKVVAFIKGSRNAPLCGFSQRVIGILEVEGVDYESVDVLDEEYNSGLRETLKKYSNWPTFPQIFVNGELVGGCDILSSMHEKGDLASLFKK